MTFVADCTQCKLSGYTINGAFAENVVAYVSHITPIPKDFPSDTVASILAGVTVYHAIKYSQTSASGWIIRLSVGHLAVQYDTNIFPTNMQFVIFRMPLWCRRWSTKDCREERRG